MHATLTKAHLAELLTQEIHLPKQMTKKFVDDFFETIREVLESGQHLKLSGFGNFHLRDKNERPGRNPKTGLDVPIKARRVVTFRPGQKLRARLSEIEGERSPL